MPTSSDDLPVGRQTPAQGVLPTYEGATILWCTVCADQRGGWCAQDAVIDSLRDRWSHPANAWLVGDFLLMPDHVHFFVTPKEGPWVEVERWTAFWKDRFSKRCGNPAWRWQRGVFHHRLRSEREYQDKGVCMANHPVRAGLVKHLSDSLALKPFPGGSERRCLSAARSPAHRIPGAEDAFQGRS